MEMMTDSANGPATGIIDMREVWSSTLAALKEQVPEPSFRTWLEGTRLNEIKGSRAGVPTAVIAVPSTFAAEWLQRRYSRSIAEALKMRLGRSVGVAFTVEAPPARRTSRAIHALDGIPYVPYVTHDSQAEEHLMPMAVGQSGPLPLSAGRAPSNRAGTYPAHSTPNPNERAKDDRIEHSEVRALHSEQILTGPIRTPGGASLHANSVPTPVLNPRYTFDRFLVGRGNQLAASVARRVAEEPGAAYNPLFIYGYRGVGKTHLLQATGNDAHARMRSRVVCLSAMLFDNPTAASRLATPDAPRSIDLLLVDDLHLIAGASGRAAQRSLAMLVEAMLAAGKGVVVTAPQPPDSMLALHETLHFRLRGGMVVALEMPDAELRLRAAGQLVEQAGAPVGPGVVELLASTRKSMAELYATWERVMARCGQSDQTGTQEQTRSVSPQDVQAVLAEIDSEATFRPHLRPDGIIDQVASYFDLEINELCDASRERRVMVPRQIAMYLIREQTDRPYQWIAHRFGRQDHTTAMHSCARIEGLLETDPEVKQSVLELRQMIFGEHQRSDAIRLAG
ncbi:MAG: hypothetical protein IVW55_00480 [Chloroflexi bacterium]|nr:hypothetical protein [Chloroflexota bacterium]